VPTTVPPRGSELEMAHLASIERAAAGLLVVDATAESLLDDDEPAPPRKVSSVERLRALGKNPFEDPSQCNEAFPTAPCSAAADGGPGAQEAAVTDDRRRSPSPGDGLERSRTTPRSINWVGR